MFTTCGEEIHPLFKQAITKSLEGLKSINPINATNIYQSFALHANLFMTSSGVNNLTIRPDFQIAT